MKYPIGIQTFETIREDGYVYVDKTALVYRLAHEGQVYFLSRPRRFGKSLLLSTLKSYFLGQKELFKGLAIEQLEQEWAEYPVFHIDFNAKVFTLPYELDKTLETFVATAEDRYGKSPHAQTLGDRLEYAFAQAYEKTGRKVVVLIDEYDKPILDVLDSDVVIRTSDGNTRKLEDYNRELLKGFYGVFKSADPYLRFVFLTGVTKFSQVSVFSGFNQPKDISMDSRYEALCGITKEEVLTKMQDYIEQLALANEWTIDEAVAQLTQQYDGYHFTWPSSDIFNLLTVPYCDNANSEGHYQQMLYVIFSLFGRYVEVEVHTPRGRVDVVMISSNTLYLFELKLNKDAATAIEQINLKDYASKFALCNLPIVKVGINFDSEQRTITDWEIVRK